MNDPRAQPQQEGRWPACPYWATASQPFYCAYDLGGDDGQEQAPLWARLLAAAAIAALLGG